MKFFFVFHTSTLINCRLIENMNAEPRKKCFVEENLWNLFVRCDVIFFMDGLFALCFIHTTGWFGMSIYVLFSAGGGVLIFNWMNVMN